MNQNPVRVLLIEDNPGDALLARTMLTGLKAPEFQVEWADRLAKGIGRIGAGGVDAILLDLSLPDSQGLETFERVRAASPRTPIVLCSGLDDEAVALRAVAMGAQDYLVKGQFDGPTLGRVLRYAIERQRKQAGEAAADGEPKRGEVFVFLGSKGGVGTTTTVLNVAAALARMRQRVIALELRSIHGAFFHHLRHAPAQGLGDLLALDQLEPDDVNSRLVWMPFGVSVLFGPQDTRGIRGIEPTKAEAVIKALARTADWVLVDCDPPSSEAVRVAVGLASRVALVMDREPASLACGKQVLEHLKEWGVPQGKVEAVVVNRAALVNIFFASEVTSQMGCGVLGVVTPAADLCMKANRQGVPLVMAEPDSAAAFSYSEIATRITSELRLRIAG